jgi:hypothetical protein
MPMKMFSVLAASVPMLIAVATPADARRVPEQDAARAATQAGNLQPYPMLRNQASRMMGGAAPIGSEFDAGSGIVRFKFQRGTSVIWLDMDGRTGRELRRRGD